MSTDTNQGQPYPTPGMRKPQIANRLNMLPFEEADAYMKHLSKYL